MFYQIIGSLVLATAPIATSIAYVSYIEHNQDSVKAEELKSWYSQKKPMIVLDARSDKYFDGRLLPNAMWLPAESSDKEILAAVPNNKDSVFVIYSSGDKSTETSLLYNKLRDMGYKNVYVYHEGFNEWTQRGYPLTTTHKHSAFIEQNHEKVNTEELKSWYNQKKPMIVIDARAERYFDGRVLPNAKWIPLEAQERDITRAAPHKDSLIVVYCAGPNCQAANLLYDKLREMGYYKVYQYNEGINEWAQNGYPLDTVRKS